ncbi:MAG: DUF445 family protein [Clostridiales bacterium]|jgi:uncharacterized membrane protein YheB (UPF0754 family)|nr:DUF445 family protein [Clostridiales bacterium]
MIDLRVFVLSPVLGAVIGYFTNWLAIKMLFRPREEKRFLGVRLPFTPGLIPKERNSLTRKVADTVGAKLLTPEVLQNELSSPRTIQALEKMLSGWLAKIRRAEMTVGDAAAQWLPLLNPQHTDGEARLWDWLEKLLADARPAAVRQVESFLTGAGAESMIKTAGAALRASLFADGKKLWEVLPPAYTNGAKKFCREHLADAVTLLIRVWMENPAIDERLSKQLRRVIEENLGRFIGFFLNPDTIYKRVKEELLVFLSSEANQNIFMDKAEEALERWLEKDAGEAWSALCGVLQKYEIGGPGTASSKPGWTEAAWEKIRSALREAVQKSSPRLEEWLTNAARGWIGKLSAMQISALLDLIGEEKIEAVRASLMRFINTAIVKGAVLIARSMDVPRMVEDKISAFEVKEVEEIILSVVKRELNAITIFGGVLGFIIGLAPGILNAL